MPNVQRSGAPGPGGIWVTLATIVAPALVATWFCDSPRPFNRAMTSIVVAVLLLVVLALYCRPGLTLPS